MFGFVTCLNHCEITNPNLKIDSVICHDLSLFKLKKLAGFESFLHCRHSAPYQRFYDVLRVHGWHSFETFQFAYKMHNECLGTHFFNTIANMVTLVNLYDTFDIMFNVNTSKVGPWTRLRWIWSSFLAYHFEGRISQPCTGFFIVSTCIKKGRCRNYTCSQCCDIQILVCICIVVPLRWQLPALQVGMLGCTLGIGVKQTEFVRQHQQTNFDFRMFSLCWLEVIFIQTISLYIQILDSQKNTHDGCCAYVCQLNFFPTSVWIVFTEINGDAQFAFGNPVAFSIHIVSTPAFLVSPILTFILPKRNSGAVGTLTMPIITISCCCNLHSISISR